MTAQKLVPARLLAIWFVLVSLSILGPTLGSEGENRTFVAAAILAFAVVKVRFVGLDFMELRHAPVAMRVVFEVYCLILWVTLVSLYLLL
ncbi:cytochrome C oxidase subunit IV family protein [Agrobacterium sp. NPDC089420]|uniref:cytochrome C oxidase subunit IV family protein n=1 Tax=Agrobacterium sp. NPDC089420 TaxID=3363918 RepID=UPI00384D1E48